MRSSDNRSRLGPSGQNCIRSVPEEFAFTKLMYEKQRQAFMNEISSCRSALQTPRPRRGSPMSMISNSPRRTDRSFELKSPRPMERRRLRYSDRLSSLQKKCDQTQELPNISVKVNKEKMLLKRYSRRMDWAMSTLQQNLDLDYAVIVPLFDYFTRERFELELAAKHAVTQLKKNKN